MPRGGFTCAATPRFSQRRGAASIPPAGLAGRFRLPGGRLVLDHVLEPAGDGTRLVTRSEAWGPMSVAFRLVFARGIRSSMPDTLRALAAEVARRTRTAA